MLAFLNDEPGAGAVQAWLTKGAVMSTVNWAEVLSKASEIGKRPDELDNALRASGIVPGNVKLIPLTEEDALGIARLREPTRTSGLSIGDRGCLALALRLGIPALTTDQSWSRAKTGVVVHVVR
jgi:PIN domain nuclease of toxin-antitoxin system